jgi:hypothetical protein
MEQVLSTQAGGEGWRQAQYVNPRVGTTVAALTGREGKLANTSLQKDEMQRLELFPPNDKDQYYKLHLAGSGHTCVVEHTVE